MSALYVVEKVVEMISGLGAVAGAIESVGDLIDFLDGTDIDPSTLTEDEINLIIYNLGELNINMIEIPDQDDVMTA